jgi:hypothetical protein
VFAVEAAGDYQLGQGWIESTSGNGLLVKIFCKGQLAKTVECGAASVAYFDARLENLAVGDEIAVAVGPDGNSTNAAYDMDFEIVRVDPSFEGWPVFDVADYGAAGDGTTDDFDAIHAAVDAAKLPGGGIVRFDGAKTYRSIGNTKSEDVIEIVFDLQDTSNIKIEGNGAKLKINPPDRLAYINASKNIQIDGFTVSYYPLPYYQGTIDAIDLTNVTADISVPLRYDKPETGTNTGSIDNAFFAESFIPEAPGLRYGNAGHLWLDSTETIGGDPRKIRLHFSSDQASSLKNARMAVRPKSLCRISATGTGGISV